MEISSEKRYRIENYDYSLPEGLIAQSPLKKRSDSRLLVLFRKEGRIVHTRFSRLPDYFSAGDCLVFNNTRVVPSRLYGKTQPTGAGIEILLLDKNGPLTYEAMMKNSRRVSPGSFVVFEKGLIAEVVEKGGKTVTLKFNMEDKRLLSYLKKNGVIPLPPYIKEGRLDPSHKTSYQTVYAKKDGAKAAPTAGLHFTREILGELAKKKIVKEEVTLHVGLGTFEPLLSEDIRSHKMHAEFFEVPKKAAAAINKCRNNNGRVAAVGTTSLRCLESALAEGGISAGRGTTSIYFYPGKEFKATDALLTNFHLPRTTLLALVYAFGGEENVKRAYNEAIEQKYRFFSYGDAMLIL